MKKFNLNSDDQHHIERSQFFRKMREVAKQFLSMADEIKENFIPQEESFAKQVDKKDTLGDYANLVTESDDLWDEFISEARKSQIITNEGVLLAFAKFANKKAALPNCNINPSHKEQFLETNNVNEAMFDHKKRRSGYMFEFVISNVNDSKLVINKMLKPRSTPNFFRSSEEATEPKAYHYPIHAVTSFNEDIYIPEESNFSMLRNSFIKRYHDTKL